MLLTLNLVYRSRPIQYPLLAAMEACNAWERAGIELRSVKYVSGAAQSDPMLVSGACDFIFGSHITPYIHRMHGLPFVYLGQTVNWVRDALVSREPMRSLLDLAGKRLSEKEGVTADRHHGHHPAGNHLLYLRRAGLDPHQVTFIASRSRAYYQEVLDGAADAAFVSPPEDEEARSAGLHVLALDPLPMVNASTMTTLWSTLENNRALCERILKAVLLGVHFIKTQPDAMWKVMQEDVATELNIRHEGRLRYLHLQNQEILEAKMYPHPLAVQNAFELAIMEEPEVAEQVNPMSLWDLHLLRTIEDSGFVRELYEGNVPGPGRVRRAATASAI